MRGLPAVMRAVPVALWSLLCAERRRPGADDVAHSLDRRTGSRETFMDLVERLSPELKRQALTHSSWVENRTGSYERLEFLGDSVLGLAIAFEVYRRFPEREEGGLARLKAFVVSRASCIEVAHRIGLADLIREQAPASEGKRREAVRSPGMLGDILEALIGAVYLEFGFERVRPPVIDLFEEQIGYAATAHVDHKTALQELLASQGLQPEYRLVEEAGPPHARMFTSEVMVGGMARGRGTGTTIKMSEQAAARQALAVLSGGAAGSPDDVDD